MEINLKEKELQYLRNNNCYFIDLIHIDSGERRSVSAETLIKDRNLRSFAKKLRKQSDRVKK